MTFYADLHLHSKHSRATSRDCDLEHIAFWAAKKGMSVVATGDFTHPAWFEDLSQKLVPAEPGLYRLRPDIERDVSRWPQSVPGAGEVRFVLQVEISTIYKRDDRTRKVHHVIYAPELAAAKRLGDRLARIGNVASDGRPILGLDSRDLLEITLDSGEGCYLIPAHIWTPWFAVLGSKSGFDSIEHCYGDLSGEIFALETGLSSDPPMNWRVSALDRYRLVSNSDAHSPPKIGREACVFDTEMDYFAIREALRTGQGYGGTVELFPEEGKYHFDGHRKCGACLAPQQTRRHEGLCPVCGKPVTLGVMYRVEELADRDDTCSGRPPCAAAFRSLVPLAEVLGEILAVGAGSKTVKRKYEELVSRLGPELFILEQAPLEDVRRTGSTVLAEGISRMRKGQVIREAGFDGQYGTIRLFTKDELRRGSSVGLLFDVGEDVRKAAPIDVDADASSGFGKGTVPFSLRENRDSPQVVPRAPLTPGGRLPTPPPVASAKTAGGSVLEGLDPEQRAAAETTEGPLLIIAGPGTGKTRTLTHRLAHLVADWGVAPEHCLAVTFTRRAAGEMTERLRRLLPGKSDRVGVMTFHALGLSILQEHGDRIEAPRPLRVASQTECLQLLRDTLHVSERKAARLLRRISRRKRAGQTSDHGPREATATADAETAAAVAAYDVALRRRGRVDFDDLVALPVRLLESNPDLVDEYRARYRWISVDEYQDVDGLQYRLIRLLSPAEGNLCAIGDPDQAIYGFRGGDVGFFQRFSEDYPTARTISLVRNYRSTTTIVDASLELISASSLVADRSLEALVQGLDRVEIHQCSTDRAEAEFVVHTVERMIGGSTFFSIDSGRVASDEGESLSFADFAVLYRTDAVAEPLVEAFARSGMPFQRRSHHGLADQSGVQALVRTMEELPGDLAVPDRLDRAARLVREDDAQVETSLPALGALARRNSNDLAAFLSELALGVDLDLWDARADRVALLTLHAAKGLEFPVVFIVGCEDGLLPLHWGSADQSDLAEERRLLFVGMTRAEKRLFLTHARKRLWRGKKRSQEISPFAAEIHELLASHEHRAVKRPKPQHQRTLFEL